MKNRKLAIAFYIIFTVLVLAAGTFMILTEFKITSSRSGMIATTGLVFLMLIMAFYCLLVKKRKFLSVLFVFLGLFFTLAYPSLVEVEWFTDTIKEFLNPTTATIVGGTAGGGVLLSGIAAFIAEIKGKKAA